MVYSADDIYRVALVSVAICVGSCTLDDGIVIIVVTFFFGS